MVLAPYRYSYAIKLWSVGFLMIMGGAVAEAQVQQPSSAFVDTTHKAVKQVDSSRVPYPNPKRAGLLSSLVPGAGQVYNKQYWKLALIYGGLGACSYFIYDNNKQYQRFRTAYIARIDGDPSTTDEFVNIYTNANALKQNQDYYKKYLDMSVLITGAVYVLQILDAVTYAYLKDFDVSKDISMRVHPHIQIPSATNTYRPGMGIACALTLK